MAATRGSVTHTAKRRIGRPFISATRTGCAHQPLTLTPHEEGRKHLAFLMGVVSHGLADEFYDATFFAASRVHDAVEGEPDHRQL